MSDSTSQDSAYIHPDLRAALAEIIGNLIIDGEIEALKVKSTQSWLDIATKEVSRLHESINEHHHH